MSLCRFFSWDSWDTWDSLFSFCPLRAHFYTCSFFALLGPFYFDASFCPFYMRAACVWCILLDLSVVFFFFCFLYINFCSDSFDIFGTFFTSVKFSPPVRLFSTLSTLASRYSTIKMIESVKSVNYVMSFFIPHSFFSNALFKNSALVVFSHS